eukprot:TRINITY_DN67287_c4_g2_i1.p1 TRINITY_DN67287_c4_g2~~TRINITY_DN67287_c4_g2_i1.p1  ORF type:complete len:177 (-),score=57.53 TRINITY_DN67287_c4_g2_i1:165-695(-)
MTSPRMTAGVCLTMCRLCISTDVELDAEDELEDEDDDALEDDGAEADEEVWDTPDGVAVPDEEVLDSDPELPEALTESDPDEVEDDGDDEDEEEEEDEEEAEELSPEAEDDAPSSTQTCFSSSQWRPLVLTHLPSFSSNLSYAGCFHLLSYSAVSSLSESCGHLVVTPATVQEVSG